MLRIDHRYSEEYARTNLCRRWIENSGPLYREFDVRAGDYDGEGYFVGFQNTILNLSSAQLSYASELMLQYAKPGELVRIKLRWAPDMRGTS